MDSQALQPRSGGDNLIAPHPQEHVPAGELTVSTPVSESALAAWADSGGIVLEVDHDSPALTRSSQAQARIRWTIDRYHGGCGSRQHAPE